MNDSEFLEKVINLLREVKEPLQAIAVFVGFIFVSLLFLTLLMFFKYYDKELDNKQKRTDDNIRRIVREEKYKD